MEPYLFKSIAFNVQSQCFYGSRIGFKRYHTPSRPNGFRQVKREETFLCSHVDADVSWPNCGCNEANRMLLIGIKIEPTIHPVLGINVHVKPSAYKTPL